MPPNGKSPNGEPEYLLDFEKPLAQSSRLIAELEAEQASTGRSRAAEIRKQQAEYFRLLRNTYAHLSAWETVQVSRHPRRPLAGDHIASMVKDFVELHGDRRYGDDRAIRCGLGRIATERVMIVAQHKGRDTAEKIECNFGCAHPEGYRKALRAMKLAEKFSLPVVTLIDTPGAYPGIGSEERGVAEAIALCMREMSRLRAPVVCAVIGEGGSGGALGIGVGDRLGMFEYAYYSVISPEGCAAILWKTGEKAAEAAEAMRITARDLTALDVIDEIIREPVGGAHRNPAGATANLERFIVRNLRELRRVPLEDLLEARYRRWRRMGKWLEVPAPSPAANQPAT
jgi:acetyl-CoA carboxylase carboxyl transferase subunit alpha